MGCACLAVPRLSHVNPKPYPKLYTLNSEPEIRNPSRSFVWELDLGVVFIFVRMPSLRRLHSVAKAEYLQKIGNCIRKRSVAQAAGLQAQETNPEP